MDRAAPQPDLGKRWPIFGIGQLRGQLRTAQLVLAGLGVSVGPRGRPPPLVGAVHACIGGGAQIMSRHVVRIGLQKPAREAQRKRRIARIQRMNGQRPRLWQGQRQIILGARRRRGGQRQRKGRAGQPLTGSAGYTKHLGPACHSGAARICRILLRSGRCRCDPMRTAHQPRHRCRRHRRYRHRSPGSAG